MKCRVCKKELIPRHTLGSEKMCKICGFIGHDHRQSTLYEEWQKAMSEHSKARIRLVVPLEIALKSAEEELERIYGRPLKKAYHAWSGLE